MRIVKFVVCSLFFTLFLLVTLFPAFDLEKIFGIDESEASAQGVCSKWPLQTSDLPSRAGVERFQTLLNQFVANECYKDPKTGQGRNGWYADSQIRDTGPFIANKSLGTHNAVRVYYSPEVFRWLQEGRDGELKDGATIIKEMYPNPAQQYVVPGTKCTDNYQSGDESYRCHGLAIMVRDTQGSWDGWFWSDGSPNISYASYPNAGFGLYCLNCHASAKSDVTFSSMNNINGVPLVFNPTMAQPNMKKPLSSSSDVKALAAQVAPSQRLPPDEDLSVHLMRDAKPEGFEKRKSEPSSSNLIPKQFVSEWYDIAVQNPQNRSRQMFLTSNQCIGCHDATQNNASQPNMIYLPPSTAPTPSAGPPAVNLSPYSEWRSSMMGLSGRDPVFFAQLETELNLHPEIADQTVDTCLSCHGVMGQRQIHLDDKGLMRLEYLDQKPYQTPAQPFGEYGALARDGVSCAVCHHISSEGFGKLDPRFPIDQPRFVTDTGRFKTGPSDQIFGPYKEVATFPMDQSLGLEPKYGEQIKSSALCGSCHTVVLPVLEVGKKYPKDVYEQALNGKIETEHEQNTYIEWLNSDYQNEPEVARRPVVPATIQTCQDCHMPSKYPSKTGRDVQFKVASIEENIFPIVDNGAPPEELSLRVRGKDEANRYGRHTLVGLNLFVMEMFNQFPSQLGISNTFANGGSKGVSFFDPMATWGNAAPGILVSKQAAVDLARNETAKVEVTSLSLTPQFLTADVLVTNLAGHKFPSGVSFRRAFIEFRVEVQSGLAWSTVWASGITNVCKPGPNASEIVPCGVIGTLRNGQYAGPLVTEYFDKQSNPQQLYQKHYDVITDERQVQIYEELVKDSNGNFTTSFISLKDPIKDNRLMPLGWRKDNYFAATTRPHGEAASDARYMDGSGTDLVTYRVPARVVAGRPYRVTATLYYQSIPPYFLQQRYAGALSGPNRIYTDSLRWYVNNLDVTSKTDVNIRNNPSAGWDQILKDQMPVRNWKLLIASNTRAGNARSSGRSNARSSPRTPLPFLNSLRRWMG